MAKSNTSLISLRAAYQRCSNTSSAKNIEPLYIDGNSVLFTRDWRQLPEFVCFDTIVQKTKTVRGETALPSFIARVSVVDPTSLAQLVTEDEYGGPLLTLGKPILMQDETTQQYQQPRYNRQRDSIVCGVSVSYGNPANWKLPLVTMEMQDAIARYFGSVSQNTSILSSRSVMEHSIMMNNSYQWFARLLLDGSIIPELEGLSKKLNDPPSILTRNKPVKK
eukprot:CAMPEP_0171293538 /NCGR_PEP_ID=MMETSP0816-20121228/1829_1 /TAXON_ID=420281 /ORGANISM="Proboscia inermis, Strain CCAP1064/1" /LENGTH=220 /DNA_ID=CAMNT_0011764503 /DNA_START=134 /DNA_END=793 /DNA_ORIENTATION=-